jgi:hypothetical protein
MKGKPMALREFWISVRTAAKLFAPQVIVDAPQLDAGEIERILRGATLWLTPGAVTGFDEKDFSFLPEAEQLRLAKLVTEFRQVANDDDFLKAAHRLREILDPIARRVSPDRWPYLSFRPIKEPAEAVEAS